MSRFEPVIGLEVHCQLGTLSKLFCACANRFGAPPSTLACETRRKLPKLRSNRSLSFSPTPGIEVSSEEKSRMARR